MMQKYIIMTEYPTGYTRWYYNPQVDVALSLLLVLLVFISIAAIFAYRNEDSVFERVIYVDLDKAEKGQKTPPPQSNEKTEKERETRDEVNINKK